MFTINLKKLCVLSVVILMAISCDNNPAEPDGDHIDADGLAIELNGVEVYKELEGEVITNNITLNINDTLHLAVHFLDHEGSEIEHEEDEEEEESLEFDISDSNIIAIMMDDDHDDDHGEDHHELEFELVGLSTGTTTFSLSLMHGEHADYNSLSIIVEVN